MQEPFIQRHPEWIAELELMLETGEKAEIQVCTPNIYLSDYFQALSSFGFQFITEEFLPRKLREGDWI